MAGPAVQPIERPNEPYLKQLENLHRGMSFHEYACDCRKPKHYQQAAGNLSILCPNARIMKPVRQVTLSEYFDLPN
jgi:hypothetical protein